MQSVLPLEDAKSHAIVDQMTKDEARTWRDCLTSRASEGMMGAVANVMTTTAYYLLYKAFIVFSLKARRSSFPFSRGLSFILLCPGRLEQALYLNA